MRRKYYSFYIPTYLKSRLIVFACEQPDERQARFRVGFPMKSTTDMFPFHNGQY